MNQEWSLDVLYHGYEDPKFDEDMKKFESELAGMKEKIEAAKKLDPVKGLETCLMVKEEMAALGSRLGEFISLKASVNTSDSKTNDMGARYDRIAANQTAANVAFCKYVASIENLDQVIAQSSLLTEYNYYLTEIKKDAAHMLSDDMEDLIAHMDITGGSAWGKLFDYLTSTLKVDYEGEVITLPAVRNLATSEDKEVRKKAYEAELASYDKIADSIAFALNNIKGQVSMLSEKKGYESPLAMTLEQCRMKKETLDAMFTAMREYLPKFWEYLKAKAKYLGYEGGLPWYEMFAPVGKMDSNYTAETARDTLVENFSHFSKELSDMMARAFAESWIDFYPHEGKVGGAFCANVTTEKQSRILTNFNGSFDSVVTLAHELGHAFHNKQIFENRILNQDYSMPVAETASTFNETHFMLSAYKKSNDPQEKLAILENLLSGTTQIICDIYSRFLFEDAVFHKCEAQFLMTNDLKEIMLDAQKQAYGDGLDQTKLHPYMWTCKGHYYSSGLSYYNFPYAFGGLFAMGLYTQFLNEGESFVPKYNALLKATATCSVEDTAKMAGIDLTKPDFWRSSLQTFANLIDEYAALIG